MQSGLDERVINANGRHLDVEFRDAQLLNQILSNWLPSLGTQTAYPLVSVVTGKCCQIHASDRAQQPRCLPVFLDRSPCNVRLGAPFDRAGIDANVRYVIEVERDSFVRKQGMSGKFSNRMFRSFRVDRVTPYQVVRDSSTL